MPYLPERACQIYREFYEELRQKELNEANPEIRELLKKMAVTEKIIGIPSDEERLEEMTIEQFQDWHSTFGGEDALAQLDIEPYLYEELLELGVYLISELEEFLLDESVVIYLALGEETEEKILILARLLEEWEDDATGTDPYLF